MVSDRKGIVQRTTKETEISLDLKFDGSGRCEVVTGVGFLDHMLTLFAVHGFFDLVLRAKGDTYVDDHHTVEDVGICLGQALAMALGDRSGIGRYGSCYLPMDEALVRVVIDISNRPFLHFDLPVREEKIGQFDSCLVKEFFRAVVQHAGLTVHIDMLHGENGHHIVEAAFKGFARALREAGTRINISGTLSSKGCL